MGKVSHGIYIFLLEKEKAGPREIGNPLHVPAFRVWLFAAMRFVGFCIHQGLQLFGGRKLYLDNPIGKGVFVDQFGSILQCLVDFLDAAAHGRNQVAGCLNAFNSTELGSGSHFVAYFRHVHIYDIAQLLLRVVRNAHVAVFAFDFYELVALAVIKSFYNLFLEYKYLIYILCVFTYNCTYGKQLCNSDWLWNTEC